MAMDKFNLEKFSAIQVQKKIEEEVVYQKTILPFGNKEV